MANAFTTYLINQGTPTVAQPTLQLLGVGSAGDIAAARIMTHPDSINFPPITYYTNPDLDVNLDNDVLRAPISTVQRTLDSSKLIRFERVTQDIIVTEIWNAAEGQRAAMPTFQFRQFYEYLINPPAFNPTAQTYITWQPRNRNDKTFQVEFFEMRVGSGGSSDQILAVRDRRTTGGGVINTGLETMDVTPTGLLDQQVALRMRIVAEVVIT